MLQDVLPQDLAALVTRYIDIRKWQISMQTLLASYRNEVRVHDGLTYLRVKYKSTVFNYRRLNLYGLRPINVNRHGSIVGSVYRYAWSSIVLTRNEHYSIWAID